MSDRWAMRCRILSDDERYVLGWEMGMLWQRMAGLGPDDPPTETRIEATIHSANDEQLVVVSGVTGWQIVSLERLAPATTNADETAWSVAVLIKSKG